MEITTKSLELVARGSNSEVYAYGSKGSRVILKLVASTCLKQAQHLRNEQWVLSKLQHEHIIRSLKYKQHICLNGTQPRKAQEKQQPAATNEGSTSSRNVLVLEYASQGSLLDFLKRNSTKLDPSQIRGLFKQIAATVAFIHHLKLENILVTCQNAQAHLKLADFGFSCTFYQNGQVLKFKSYKGTRRGYMAPEIHQVLEDSEAEYDATKADVFALGVILFALILGKLPFEFANKGNRIYQEIISKNFDKFWSNHQRQLFNLESKDHCMLEDLKNLLEGMLSYEPEQRLSIEQVVNHSWMKGHSSKISI